MKLMKYSGKQLNRRTFALYIPPFKMYLPMHSGWKRQIFENNTAHQNRI